MKEISNVIDISDMFRSSSLTNLDLSNFDISNVTSMTCMFRNMPSESTIYVKDETLQSWILNSDNGHSSSWTTDNVVIKS